MSDAANPAETDPQTPVAGDAGRGRSRRRVIIVWGLMIAIGLFVQLWQLGTPDWATDEPVYRNAGYAYIADHNYSQQPAHPPLGKFLIGISQVVFGNNAFATRLPSALAALGTGLVLAWLAAELAMSLAAAPLVFGLWLLTPHPKYLANHTKLAYLDPMMMFFMVLAIAFAWRWMQRGTWKWAVPTAVAAGLAMGTKQPAVFGLLIIGLMWLCGAIPGIRNRVNWPKAPRWWQMLAIIGISGFFAFAVYAPMGAAALDVIKYGAQHRRCHALNGAEVTVAGTTYRHAPWWTFFSWEWQAHRWYALLQALVLPAAWLLLTRRLALLMTICIASTVLFVVISPVKLFHYSLIYEPFVLLTLALVLVELVRRWRIIGSIVAVGAVVIATGGWFTYTVDQQGTEAKQRARILRETTKALAKYDNEDNFIASGISHIQRLTYRSRLAGPDSPEARSAALVLVPGDGSNSAVADRYTLSDYRRIDIADGARTLFVRKDAATTDRHVARGVTEMPRSLWLCSLARKHGEG